MRIEGHVSLDVRLVFGQPQVVEGIRVVGETLSVYALSQEPTKT